MTENELQIASAEWEGFGWDMQAAPILGTKTVVSKEHKMAGDFEKLDQLLQETAENEGMIDRRSGVILNEGEFVLLNK